MDINSTIGPTGTIKRLFRNRDYFRNRNYEMEIFALQQIKRRWFGNKMRLCKIKTLCKIDNNNSGNNILSVGWKSLLKSRKHAFVESNYLTSALAYRKTKLHNASIIKNYIKKNRNPDIVVFHEVDSCYHYLKYRKDKTAKVVVFIHADGSDGEMFLKRRPKLKNSCEYRNYLNELSYTYEHSDRIVWISRIAKDKFCSNYPEYAHKTVAVVNGIEDTPVIELKSSTRFKYRLVSTGTVCERKGQYIIVEAMSRMKKEILNETHLTIIGTGPDHSRLVDLVNKYGIIDNVTFTGSIPNNDIPRHLASESIYILMSNNEGLPISILEAMRAGLPIISTKVAGIPEEVDERNGVLLDPNVEQLTEVLNHLPDYEWSFLGKASRLRFEKEFTFENMSRSYADMFDSLFNDKE